MIKADGLLYIAGFFCKEAEWQDLDVNRASQLISWLTGRTINLEETKEWLNQNENILKSYNILAWKDMQPEHYKHVLCYYYMSGTDNMHEAIISVDRSLANDIQTEVISEGFIKGYKNIPNLYLFTITESGFKEEPGTKEEASYKFLDPLFKEINGRELIGKEFQNEKRLFIQTNKIILDKLLSSFAQHPRQIGQGDDGIAYSVSPSLVFKVFTDQFSYLKAKESFERLHKNPELGKNEAMIYDIGILGKFNNKPVYYYIIEKMETLNTSMKKYLAPLIGAIATYINKNKETFNRIMKELHEPKNHGKIQSYLNIESNKIKDYLVQNYSDQIETIDSAEDLNKDWVKNLAEEMLFKYITNRGDLHLGNLGITNYGKFIYFDPSHENWENDLNVPSRDDIDFLGRDNIEADEFDDLLNN